MGERLVAAARDAPSCAAPVDRQTSQKPIPCVQGHRHFFQTPTAVIIFPAAAAPSPRTRSFAPDRCTGPRLSCGSVCVLDEPNLTFAYLLGVLEIFVDQDDRREKIDLFDIWTLLAHQTHYLPKLLLFVEVELGVV